MKIFQAIGVLLIPAVLMADTYIYRVDVNVFTKAEAKTMATPVETKSEGQPFVNTYVLTPGDTNYALLKMTPEDGQDKEFEKTSGFDLYQVQKMDGDGFIVNVVDNSKIFPVDKNWAVGTSSK